MKKFESNAFTLIVLWFIVITQIMKIFSTCSTLSLNSMFGADPTYGITIILFAAAIALLALLSAILKSPYFLGALLIVILLRTFLQMPFGTDIAYAYCLGGNTVDLIKDGIPLFIGLCIRPGWKAFFRSFRNQVNEAEVNDAAKNVEQ